MEVQKVHLDLKSVQRGKVYHLGHYEVDFPDGSLTFQLHAAVCDDPHCLCDNLRMDWRTGDSLFQSWYTSDGEWLAPDLSPLSDELVGVFRIVEDIDTFRERYGHMMYLRRKQVLEETGRFEGPFSIRIPRDLVGPDGDPGEGILGRLPIASGGPGQPFRLDFCDDPTCFCSNIFLTLPGDEPPPGFVLDPEGDIKPTDHNPAALALLEAVKAGIQKSPNFQELLNFFRTERRLDNYHRYVTRYPKEVGLRL